MPRIVGKMAGHVVFRGSHRAFSADEAMRLGNAHGRAQARRSYLEFVFRYNRRFATDMSPFQIRSATGQHRRHGGVSGGGKGRGQGL